jgi:UDP:flavonoid glycosyltransferase YjiC (YdhE family)
MRIVFASLGSLGDLHPLLALARAAGERGHETVIAASKDFRDYVVSLGFEYCPIRPDFTFDAALVGHLWHPRRGPERLMREQVFPSVRETYADLLAAARGADFLVVGELLYVAPLVAAKLGIPWANAILAPTSFLSACDPCVLAPAPALYPLRHLGGWTHRAIFALGRAVTSRWSAPLQAFRRELGFSGGPSPVFDGKHSPMLVLALFPRFLAAPQRDWPPHVVQTGFPFFQQPGRTEAARRIDDFLADGPPPIVFTLGSSVVHIAENFYRSAAEASRELGRRAILLTGRNPAPADLPATVLAVDYAPLESVLPRAAAVVHQGGIGTCAEALRAGIPSLVVPFGFDQPDNGERLRRLGVARVLRRERVTAATLAAKLRELLGDPSITARARELAAGIHPAADLERSLDAIERVGRVPAKIAVALDAGIRQT